MWPFNTKAWCIDVELLRSHIGSRVLVVFRDHTFRDPEENLLVEVSRSGEYIKLCTPEFREIYHWHPVSSIKSVELLNGQGAGELL